MSPLIYEVNFALLVAEHQQETGILVVDVLNAFLLKAAVLLLLGVNADGIQVTDVLVSHDNSLIKH